jgi:four helix bundle protein
MRNFRQLSVWSKRHLLTLKFYTITKSYPKEEMFGLVSQLRRAAYSIPSNTTKGCGRNTTPDFKRFPTITSGSSSEVTYQLFLSNQLGFISDTVYKELENQTIEIRKIIYVLIKKLDE